MESLLTQKVHDSFSQTYGIILSFLDLSSLLNLLPVSTEFFDYVNSYFKFFLLSSKLVEPTNKPLQADHYQKLFRAFYSRDILVSPLPQDDILSELKLVRHCRGSNLGIKNFDIGQKFAVFHLHNNDLIFLKTEEYFDRNFQFSAKIKKNTRSQVAKFFNRTKNLMYLTTHGTLHVVFHEQNLESTQFQDFVVPISKERKVRDFFTGYKHGLLFLEPKPVEKAEDEALEENKQEEKVVKQEVLAYKIEDLTPDNLNDKAKFIRTSGLSDETIVSCVVGNNTAYFLNEKGLCLEMDLMEHNSSHFQAKHFRAIAHVKHIKKIYGSYSFFFAVDQEYRKPITEWTVQEIIDWMTKLGLGEFTNVIKYKNITGDILLQADDDFLVDTLGVMKADLKVKILNEIQKVSKPTLKAARLWAWGNNNNGQLAINKSHTTVSQPIEIALPTFKGDLEILDIACGMKQTVLVTKDELLMTDPVSKNPKKEDEEPAEQGQKKKGKKKDKEKEAEDAPKLGESQYWINITKLVKNVENHNYKVEAVSFNKDQIAILGSNQGLKKDIKLKRADNILDRIRWDEKLDPKEFTVGYVDRFLGVLEIPFKEFTLKTDIPSHRIQYFKKSGEVVWDRTKRLNIL